jgi:hypothetical protein
MIQKELLYHQHQPSEHSLEKQSNSSDFHKIKETWSYFKTEGEEHTHESDFTLILKVRFI